MTVMAVRKDIPLLARQYLLSHDRLTTIEIYLNLSPEEVRWEFWEEGLNQAVIGVHPDFH